MHKIANWESALSALVGKAHGWSFSLGEHDCCLWATECADVQTGQSRAKDYRGTYADASGAARMLRKFGGLRGVGARLGDQIPVRQATNGDIGIVRYEGRPLLALCAGAVWLAVGTAGLVSIDYFAATHAWRVGHG